MVYQVVRLLTLTLLYSPFNIGIQKGPALVEGVGPEIEFLMFSLMIHIRSFVAQFRPYSQLLWPMLEMYRSAILMHL